MSLTKCFNSNLKHSTASERIFRKFSVHSSPLPTLHGFKTSQPVRSVALLCKLGNVQHNFNEINVFKNQHKTAEFLKLNPFGVIPAWEEPDGFGIGESAAILTYICDKYSLENFYPPDLKIRAKINGWMHWNHTNTRAGTDLLRLVLFSNETKEIRDLKIIERRSKANSSLSHIEKHLGGGQKYLVGDQITLADLAIIPEIDQLMPGAYGLIDFTPYPNIIAYVDRFSKNEGYEENIAPIIAIAKRLSAKLSPYMP